MVKVYVWLREDEDGKPVPQANPKIWENLEVISTAVATYETETPFEISIGTDGLVPIRIRLTKEEWLKFLCDIMDNLVMGN